MTAWLLRLLGGLMMVSAATLLLTHAPDRAVETLVARWALPPSDFLQVKGQFVHLRDVGPRDDPVPIVLIHGTSSSLHTWQGWVDGLSRQRRVITFDLPGFGLSGPRASADYHPDTDARFVLDLLDALEVPRAVLGGNSLGGEVAWRLATLAPARVDRLVLVDTAGLRVQRRSLPLGWVLAQIPVLNRLAEWVLPRALVAEGVAKAYGGSDKISSELVDRYFDLTLREGNRRALAERIRQYTPGEHAERLAALRVPTLLLWGARDTLIPLEVGREFKARIVGSELVIFDDLAHLPHEEAPALTLVPVKAFLGLR